MSRGLFPEVGRSPGLKTEGQERAFFQINACVLEDRIGNLVFNEFVFDLRPVMVHPVKNENISRLETLFESGLRRSPAASWASEVSSGTSTHKGFNPSSLVGTEKFSLPFNRIRRLADSRIFPVERWFLRGKISGCWDRSLDPVDLIRKGAFKGKDGLVVVEKKGDVGLFRGKLLDELYLDRIEVLGLIDQDVRGRYCPVFCALSFLRAKSRRSS